MITRKYKQFYREKRRGRIKGPRSQEMLFDARNQCDHVIEVHANGIKCVKCGGWVQT